MLYLTFIILLPASFYTFSYAGYNWKNKNRKAAFGLVLMVAASVILPVIFTLLSE